MIKAQARYLRIKVAQAFTLLEIMIVVAILTVVAGLAVESGWKSLERARIDAVAIDMAGWLLAMHANNSEAATFAAATACFVDVAGASNTTDLTTSAAPVDASYSNGAAIFVIRNTNVNGVNNLNQCSNPVRSFVLPTNATGAYRIRAYSPIIFSLRGSIAVSNNNAGNVNDNDIKIYRDGSRLLRCVRVYYSTGTIRIGSNGNAASIADSCSQFNTF
jgi:prepilin-type N-terminal cleavage/methylation domain-containing protein